MHSLTIGDRLGNFYVWPSLLLGLFHLSIFVCFLIEFSGVAFINFNSYTTVYTVIAAALWLAWTIVGIVEMMECKKDLWHKVKDRYRSTMDSRVILFGWLVNTFFIVSYLVQLWVRKHESVVETSKFTQEDINENPFVVIEDLVEIFLQENLRLFFLFVTTLFGSLVSCIWALYATFSYTEMWVQHPKKSNKN
jgi:hypothetical protein